MKNLLIKIVLIISLSTFVYAEPSMRRCMILPVKDSVGGVIGVKVFELIERYLKSSTWCFYQSNSEIMNILSNHRNTLDQALESSEVLKLISDKTNAGSLIKVRLENLTRGMKVTTSVIGPNGKDIYFEQTTDIESDEIEVIAQTVNNWLDVYEKNIPYDARVLGVLGTQFTVDIGQAAGLYNGYEIQIVRPVKKQKHPLLNEIVDWKTMPIAKAKIFHVGLSQSQASILQYERETLVQVDDWVIVTKNSAANPIPSKMDYNPSFDPKDTTGSFGKLGTVGLYLNLGSGSVRVEGTNSKELSGMTFGVGINTEVWATRNYWAGLDIDKQFGSFSKSEGNVQKESNSLSYSKFKIKAGYKYLPLGFFYGPQLDAFVGYGSYTYSHDVSVADKISEFKYSGLFFGVRGSIPVIKDIRMSIALDFMLSPSMEESVRVLGEADSVKNYTIEILGNYKYSPSTDFEGGIEYISNSADFETQNIMIKDKTLSFKGGAKLNF